jgi:hypothetical protein
MSTLPIGAVTAQDIIGKFGDEFELVAGELVVRLLNDFGKNWFYIKNTNDGWLLCLEVSSNGEALLHINPSREATSSAKRLLPVFNYSDYEGIREDYLETFYALCHSSLATPLHNSRGQVRRKTVDKINELLGTCIKPKQSLAIWYTTARQQQVYSSRHARLMRGVLGNKFPLFFGASYARVEYIGTVQIESYILQNLGYTLQGLTWTLSTDTNQEQEGAIPAKYLQVMNYSTRVPNELGFKTVEDKKGKFDIKFKQYYKQYVESLNSNSTTEYNPLAPVYLGLELEYEVDEDFDRDGVVADKIMPKLYPHGICKSDGSLEYGIEVVTVPAVYEEHVKALSPLFDDFPSEYIHTGRTCGLHIHISRAPFNLPTQGRMIAFMNNEHNAQFLQKIGGRDFNSYAKQDTSRSVASILRGGGERYNVLNLNNKATLEFRLFKGTTDFNFIKRSMQFCLAIAEYCKNLTMPIKEFTKHENFVEWVKTQRKVYPELVNSLSPRKEIPQQYRNQRQSI